MPDAHPVDPRPAGPATGDPLTGGRTAGDAPTGGPPTGDPPTGHPPTGGRTGTGLRLVDRRPRVAADRALGDLVVPRGFADATLGSYRPDPGEPSQTAARDAVARFADAVAQPVRRRGWLRRGPGPRGGSGVYLDGGFGVGKTHLAAAAAHAVAPAGQVAFGTFVQYTALVGALGFAATRDALAGYRLVCIDEFELDDPGDTVLVSTLLGELTAAGVSVAATSNTLPGALGEERFAAEDFRREIQGLADRFEVVHVDGPDFRHRDATAAALVTPSGELPGGGAGVAVDDFTGLVSHLAGVHPAAYGTLVDGVGAVAWSDVAALPDQNAALRFVVLVDRLYDRGVAVRASGLPLTDVFTAEMLAGGYRKKYGRARSRLAALTRLPGLPETTGSPGLPGSTDRG